MVDYCETKLSVATRTLHFVDLILDSKGKTLEDFETFDDFVKFLNKNEIRRCAGFNKNKKGYMETLKFAYSLRNET